MNRSKTGGQAKGVVVPTKVVMSGLVELKITFCIRDLSFRKELKSNIINIFKRKMEMVLVSAI